MPPADSGGRWTGAYCRWAVERQPYPASCDAVGRRVTGLAMSDPLLADAFDRAERALDRIERAATGVAGDRQREQALRRTVETVVAELDQMIRASGAR